MSTESAFPIEPNLEFSEKQEMVLVKAENTLLRHYRDQFEDKMDELHNSLIAAANDEGVDVVEFASRVLTDFESMEKREQDDEHMYLFLILIISQRLLKKDN